MSKPYFEAMARAFYRGYDARGARSAIDALADALRLAVEQEREACAEACRRLAKLYEQRASEDDEGAELHLHMAVGADACAIEILKRGKDAP